MRLAHKTCIGEAPKCHADLREEAYSYQELWHLGPLPVTYWLP